MQRVMFFLLGFVLLKGQAITWTGAVDRDWHKPCNWSPERVPTCSDSVVVPDPISGNYPVVSGIAHCNKLSVTANAADALTILNGANIDISSNGGTCSGTPTVSPCTDCLGGLNSTVLCGANDIYQNTIIRDIIQLTNGNFLCVGNLTRGCGFSGCAFELNDTLEVQWYHGYGSFGNCDNPKDPYEILHTAIELNGNNAILLGNADYNYSSVTGTNCADYDPREPTIGTGEFGFIVKINTSNGNMLLHNDFTPKCPQHNSSPFHRSVVTDGILTTNGNIVCVGVDYTADSILIAEIDTSNLNIIEVKLIGVQNGANLAHNDLFKITKVPNGYLIFGNNIIMRLDTAFSPVMTKRVNASSGDSINIKNMIQIGSNYIFVGSIGVYSNPTNFNEDVFVFSLDVNLNTVNWQTRISSTGAFQKDDAYTAIIRKDTLYIGGRFVDAGSGVPVFAIIQLNPYTGNIIEIQGFNPIIAGNSHNDGVAWTSIKTGSSLIFGGAVFQNTMNSNPVFTGSSFIIANDGVTPFFACCGKNNLAYNLPSETITLVNDTAKSDTYNFATSTDIDISVSPTHSHGALNGSIQSCKP